MRKIIAKYLPAIPVAFILASTIFSHSCANTSQAPTGGLKDTIPPIIMNIVPYPGTCNIPCIGSSFAFTFDEYVKVSNPKNITFSPPLKTMPKTKMRGKTMIVYFEEDTLRANTTYTIDFTNALEDNNDGNKFLGYTYCFSTGPVLDSMMMTGTVYDCNTMKPVKDATVMLYKDHSDSAVFNSKPFLVCKTDDWGFFSIRNIQDTLYRMYAMKDEAQNNMFDIDADLIAFEDTLVRPVNVVSDDVYELKKFDMLDTVMCLKRKSEHNLNLYKEKAAKQFIKDYKRLGDRSAYVSFRSPNAHIDTLWIAGIPSDRIISQINLQRDSLELWINDQRRMPDTLNLFVNYRKTDTLGFLSPFTESIKLIHPEAGKRSSRRQLTDIKHEDTICVAKLVADPALVEQLGVSLEFTYPIIYEHFDSLTLIGINPRQQEEKMSFTVSQDSLNLRKYNIIPESDLQRGYEYRLKIPHHAFKDITGFLSDSLETKFSLPSDEKLSSISLTLNGVNGKYIVDLVGEDRSTVKRTYVIDSDCTLLFPYLSAGNYMFRITEDRNRNSIVDGGSILEHKQPEKVIFLQFGSEEGSTLKVEEMMEISQTADIEELFK